MSIPPHALTLPEFPPLRRSDLDLLLRLSCPDLGSAPPFLGGFQLLGAVVMEHMDEHDSDDMPIPLAVAADGVDVAFVLKRKKRSKVWDEYKPIYVNGVIQNAECRYCHIFMSCKGADGHSNGTSHLWRHQKICRAKEGLDPREFQETDFPYVLNEIDPVDQILPDSIDNIDMTSHGESNKFRSKVWKEFRPVYIEGRIHAADCVHCHKRLSAEKGRSHLSRHTHICPARGTRINLQKGAFFPSSAPSLKSGVQDELSPALTNGKVQIAEYASKLLKGNSSSDKTPQSQHILALPALDNVDSKEHIILSAHAAPDISTRKFDQEAAYQELTRMIVLHGYPLSIVEHEEMRRFAKGLNPVFNMASTIDIEEYSTLLYQKEKADLKEKIALSSRRVSLSASVWAPHVAEPTVKYLCLTAHFIDAEWKLQKRIIKFGVFWSSPTDLERMIRFKEACVLDSESGPFNVIGEAVRDWNLDHKLFSLMSVSEIRNHGGTTKLKDMLIQRNNLPIRGELYNIACVDDVLNNIVSKGQPMLHVVGDILERFMQAHASSSLTQQQLLEVVSNVGFKCPEEDAKWWHKIHFRLEVVLHFRKAFPSKQLLPAEDIKIVESICKILRAFYRAIEVISGPVCLTANMYFNELWKVRMTLQEEASTDHTEVASMVKEMQEAFHEYWENSYLWLSLPVVLDPRFKITFIEFRLKRAFGTGASVYVSAIHEIVRELFQEYCSPVDKPGVHTSNCEAGDVEMDVFDSDSLEDWDQHISAQSRNQQLTELDNYLQDALVPRKDDFDILNWWMSHSAKYPTLSAMAQDVLAMPSSAVHCKVAFSDEGPVIPKQWSTLNIKTIEALVCTQDWIR